MKTCCLTSLWWRRRELTPRHARRPPRLALHPLLPVPPLLAHMRSLQGQPLFPPPLPLLRHAAVALCRLPCWQAAAVAVAA